MSQHQVQRTKLKSAVSVLTFVTLYQVSSAAVAVHKPDSSHERTLQDINTISDISEIPPLLIDEDVIKSDEEVTLNPSEPPVLLPEEIINLTAEDDQDETDNTPEQPLDDTIPTDAADDQPVPDDVEEEGPAPEDPTPKEPSTDGTGTEDQADVVKPQIDEPSNEEADVVDPSQADDNPIVEDKDNTEGEEVDPTDPIDPIDPADPAIDDKEDQTNPIVGDNGADSGEAGDDSSTPDQKTDDVIDENAEDGNGEANTDGDQNGSPIDDEGDNVIEIDDGSTEDDDDSKQDDLVDVPDDTVFDGSNGVQVEEEVTEEESGLQGGLDITSKSLTSRIRSFGSKQDIPNFSSKGVAKESDRRDPENDLELMAYIIGGGLLFVIIICAVVYRLSRVVPGRATVAVFPAADGEIEINKTSNSHQRSLAIIDEENKVEADSIGKLSPRNARQAGEDDCGPMDSNRQYSDGSPLKDKVRAQSTISESNQNSMFMSNQAIDMRGKDAVGNRIFSAKTRSDVTGAHKDAISTIGGSDVNQASELASGTVLLPSIAANKRSFGANGTMIEDLPGFDDATIVADASQENRPEQEKGENE